MTLPDWDFGGDEEKRRAFVAWVNEELDRFAQLTTCAPPASLDCEDWATILKEAKPAPRSAGRPADEWSGMNSMVWEFGLLRYMFNRYWPGKKRRIADRASAASIAVNCCQRAIPANQRTKSRLEARRELAARVFEEWERGSRSPGRKQAEADIAILNELPADRFPR